MLYKPIEGKRAEVDQGVVEINWQGEGDQQLRAEFTIRQDYFLSDRFIGASYESLPVDLSEARLCESRCFGTLDDMNDWASNPKYMIAEGDTYQKYPGDETYPQLAVNYVRPDRVPRFNEDVSSITRAMQSGQFFVTTGEILFRNRSVEGSGPDRAYTAEVE